MLFGQTQANAPSRFLDDLPEAVTERRSDDVLSAFAWASKQGAKKAQGNIEPFNQDKGDIDIEFNQDTNFDSDMDQDVQFTEGSRVQHPTFGKGTVIAVRGDIIDIKFDRIGRRTLAMSIAPLTGI